VKNILSSNLPFVNLYKKKDLRSSVVTQLLYGDNFKIIKKYGKWYKIRIKHDGYIGYIKNRKFSKFIKPNYKVSVLKAKIFRKPNTKSKSEKFLSYGSKIKILKKVGNFARIEKSWIKTSDIKPINLKYKNFFLDAKLFRNIKYVWGAKGYKGIDCSALIQILLNQNNKYCPRDSKDQENYFKKKVKIKNIKKNDLIFWKGHVAIALSKKKLIHAYGPMKKVVIMNVKKTIERIKRTANLEVTSVRRI
tara:strand:- start:237 stop:980 length:744 start_codon:yes stop_codon:yes gene_type:complete